ncbi:MAG TPA: inositol 2-dehydrogenase [Ilumatobacteraceae bacterium]|nr:inositol 2-dehydrogenase [Ilumatobacteraceae bacterium]
MTIRIGVLGVGRIGKMHAELLATQVPGASLAMVQDINAPAAAAVAAQLDVPYTADAEELLASAHVDAVAICSSTDTHVPLLVASAKAGKAIFCEKPVSLDLAEVDEGLGAVEASGVPIQIGFNRRFDPAHASVRAAVVDGSVGDLHILRITSRDPAPPPIAYIKVSGGLFLDMMIHDFDMARFVTGSEVVDVHANAAVRVDPAIGEAGDVDTAVVVMRHENGCITAIDNSRQAVYGYDQRVEAFGSGGMAASENPFTHTGIRRTAAGTLSPTIPYFFLDRYIPSYVEEWKAFVNYITDGGPSPVSASDGRAPLVIGLAAWKSFREGRTVRCDEIG